MRTLDSRQVVVTETVCVHESNGPKQRFLFRGGSPFLSEADGYERSPEFAMGAGRLDGKAVAWIGGGFCIGPRVFAIADCSQTVYEIEPSLQEFCPKGIEFIPGDWKDTIKGKYDVIIFDLGGEVPRADLAKNLNAGGIILPKDDK